MVTIRWARHLANDRAIWPKFAQLALLLGQLVTSGNGMTDDRISSLRQDTRDLFYHGFTNYMTHAFPEDELKPLSCRPQTRNRKDPNDIGLNDVLGNYSLTLIDSLSSLAILASGEDESSGRSAQQDFQNGVRNLVGLYGNGSRGSCGSRACGFDLDSKVQVFETNIRGVGGLLSAHLFAVGELPIRNYKPVWEETSDGVKAISWDGWMYTGQLLQLARDLATRLLPAFSTQTGIPYPRVNLRYGIPFYQGRDANNAVCYADGTQSASIEITETCSAGAGSLVLEFATLSRLTGEPLFEDLAKKAFWAVWDRRSTINLLGAGIDAETGQWIIPQLAGVGAGIDSFLEYAFKSHILLSHLPPVPSVYDDGSHDSFYTIWKDAHAAIKRHIYRTAQMEKHPFYSQNDMTNGALRYAWVDNLSAYYPGLLTLAGELEEAIESHLLYAALWTRYSAIPERWQVYNAFIDPNFKHWAGRPEFIESTFYLYQATHDPYYLHVGEMALRDIRRRCWTQCGWADLRDVVSGEKRDRMESFFLGETAKYLYLLFDPSHPLNQIDAPIVFTTEGHPLVIPRTLQITPNPNIKPGISEAVPNELPEGRCPAPLLPLPLTVSNVANRADLFHAAAITNLHLIHYEATPASHIVQASEYGPEISYADIRSPTNYSYYPWTLPADLAPVAGYSSRIQHYPMSTLSFPDMTPGTRKQGEANAIPIGALSKVLEGIVVSSLSNVRFNMIQEPQILLQPAGNGLYAEMESGSEYRVSGIANFNLGRDEKVIITTEALREVNAADPFFTRIKDLEMLDLIIDIPANSVQLGNRATSVDRADELADSNAKSASLLQTMIEAMATKLLNAGFGDHAAASKLQMINHNPVATPTSTPTLVRYMLPAVLPTGVGAAPLSPVMDDDQDTTSISPGALPLRNILFLDDTLCTHQLPASSAKAHSVLVIKRGGCSFSKKLANIPAVAPSSSTLHLVIVISPTEDSAQTQGTNNSKKRRQHGRFSGTGYQDPDLIRPLLDEPQRTPAGFERRNALAMLMVDGSDDTVQVLRKAASVIAEFDANGEFIILESSLQSMNQGAGMPGLGIKRRFWFESQGVPINNLIML